MIVAVSSTGKHLSDPIDPRFGRCAYYLIADTDSMEFEVFDNESIALGGGAGIQSAQFIASKQARAVITGNCGPNAVQTLKAAGVELIVGQTGPVDKAIERYKAGRLKITTEPNVSDHYGMGEGDSGYESPNLGRAIVKGQNNFSMGRGGGMGMGRGNRCGGMGRRSNRTGVTNPRVPTSEEDHTASENRGWKELMGQMKILKDQLDNITNRIDSLEKR